MRFMKLFLYILSLAPLIARSQNKAFVPLEYEYPKEILSSPKVYVYKNSATAQSSYKEVSRRDSAGRVIVNWKDHGWASPIDDSAVEINDKTMDHYLILNGQYFKGKRSEDSTYRNGSRFGEKRQSECFDIGSALEVCGVIRSYFLKDTVLTWQNKKVGTVVIESKARAEFKNPANPDQKKETDITTWYYFGKNVGLMLYRSTGEGKTEVWELQEIREQKQ